MIMPELDIAPPPTAPKPTPAPTPTPEPAPVPSEPKGPKLSATDRAAAEIESMVGLKKPDAVAPKEPAKPAETKPGEIPPEKPANVESEIKGPKWYRTALDEHKAKSQQTIASLQKELATAKTKPADAPDAKVVESLQSEIKQMRGLLKQKAYEHSDEFKGKYLDPYNNALSDAVEEVKSLSVRYQDGEEVKTRPATEGDFKKLMALPVEEQDARIEAMFGHSARRVFNHIADLNRIRREGHSALLKAREQEAAGEREQAETSKAQQKQFERARVDSQKAIEEKWPELFSADHYESDPDSKKILEDGYAYVDSILSQSAESDVNDRAAYASALRSRAAALPLVHSQLQKVKAEVESLKAELAKYRESDPGSPSSRKPVDTGEPKQLGGINEATEIFNTV